jgi:hypothetical protein
VPDTTVVNRHILNSVMVVAGKGRMVAQVDRVEVGSVVDSRGYS